MKKIMMMGPVSAGKTSLLQRLKGEQMHYVKTQAIEFDGTTIDTPGEYMENRQYQHALTVTACDADIVVFVQDAQGEEMWYSPGQVSMFSAEAIGVVTKIDLASEIQIRTAETILRIAGIENIFFVSNTEGTGVEELLSYIEKVGISTYQK